MRNFKNDTFGILFFQFGDRYLLRKYIVIYKLFIFSLIQGYDPAFSEKSGEISTFIPSFCFKMNS